jgi:2-dehydro-3-deoxy-D-pentonate aldolase
MRLVMPDLKGLIVPIVTPKFNSEVDFVSFEKLINYLINSGVDGLFVLGTTGEFQYISQEDKKEIILKSAEFCAGRVPIIVGVSDKDLDNALDLIEFSQRNKVDGIVVAPMFFDLDAYGVMGKVLEKITIPLIFYNNPNIHGHKNIPLELIKKYKDHPKVIGIKDSSGDKEYFKELVNLSDENFKVFQGRESLALESLSLGIAGLVSGNANFIPELFKELVLSKSVEVNQKIIDAKTENEKLDSNVLLAIKKRLVKNDLIKSDETFF